MENGSVRKIVHHSAPRPDILSPWRQLLSLPMPCHVHWPRFARVARARLPCADNPISGTGSACTRGNTCSVRAFVWGSQRMGEWWAVMRCVFPWCGVGHGWTLGLVRRPVALSGMLLWWPSGAFGSCCIESRWIKAFTSR
jgi:hypothetical protein